MIDDDVGKVYPIQFARHLIKLARPGVHLKDLERLWQKNRENMGEYCGARSARKGRP